MFFRSRNALQVSGQNSISVAFENSSRPVGWVHQSNQYLLQCTWHLSPDLPLALPRCLSRSAR